MGESVATNPRIDSIDGLRFLMCVGIANLHLSGYFWNTPGEDVYVDRFRYFTDVFFILSGFFLGRSNLASRAAAENYPRFILLRWARIYPLYALTLSFYVAVAAAAALGLISPSNPERYDLSQLWSHLLLMQSWGGQESLIFNYPAWSLSALWLFALLFPAVLPLMRTPWLLGGLTLAALFATAATGEAVCGLPVTRLQICGLGALNGLSPFLFGVWLAALGRFRLPRPLVIAGLLFATWLLFGAPWVFDGLPRRFAVAAFVLFFLAADHIGVRTPLGARLLRQQGKYAFGLYLLHAIVATVFLRALAGGRLDLENLDVAFKLALLGAALALSYGLAVLTYWTFEMPVFRYFRDRRWTPA